MSASFFDAVETELTAAATRRMRARRGPAFLARRRLGGPLAMAGAVLVAGGAALAATGQIQLGSPEPVVRHSAAASGMGLGVPPAHGARLLAVRSPDPVAGPPWGIRVFRSSRGYRCAQIGRVVAGRLVILDAGDVAHELALHCTGIANPGSSGLTRAGARELVYGYPGPRARTAIVERSTPPRRLVLPVRDGAYLAVYAHGARRSPHVAVILGDGTRQSAAAPPVPAPQAPPVTATRIATSPRSIGPRDSLEVTFRAPAPVVDNRLFYRAEANGPHRPGCAGRLIAGTQRNYARGGVVRLVLRPPGGTLAPSSAPAAGGWCRGTFAGRVSLGLRRTVGYFHVTVR